MKEYAYISGLASDPGLAGTVGDILADAMGIVRNKEDLESALGHIGELIDEHKRKNGIAGYAEKKESGRLMLAKAIIQSALYRKESRGAHFRSDYPDSDDAFKGIITCCRINSDEIDIRLSESYRK